MITFHDTMDSYSLDIKREGKHIGYLMWHKYREPRVELVSNFEHLTLSELEQVTAKLQEKVKEL